MRALGTLLALLAVAGCSNRERANPFDPRNPRTRGGPAGFVALAGDGHVDLSWEAVSGQGMLGYRIHRQTEAETTYSVLSAVLAPGTNRYADYGLLNGLEHRYRIFFVFEGEGDRGPPAEDVATPGPARPWVADAGQGRVARLTPDGRRVVAEYGGYIAPTSVGTDSARGLVWVSDTFSGRVTVLDPSTGVTVSIPGLDSPGVIAVDPLDRSAWVCDEGAGALYNFDASGATVGSPIQPLELPIGVAIDPTDRSVWVCERSGNRVRRHASDRSLIWSVTVDRPSRVAVDSLSRRGWVTSFESGRLTRVAPSGTVELTIPGLQGPIGVAVDARRGRVWVADALAGEVLAFDRSGNQQFRIPGLPEIRELSLDVGRDEAWGVLPGRGEVVRLSGAGQVLRRLGGFGEPFGISVDPGRR